MTALSPDSLLPGEAYYHLRFADAAMTVPAVEPVIFIGEDVFPDEQPDAVGILYFQDALSYRFCGSAAGDDFRPHPDIEPLVHPIEPEEVGESLLDLDGVIGALQEARQRALPIQ